MIPQGSAWSGPFSVALAGLLVIGVLPACGKAGPPIAPEDLGVAAKLERERHQRERHEEATTQTQDSGTADAIERPRTGAPPNGGVVLPPLRPIGTQ